ncbi:MAG TPA: type II toxin-antitoxin system ParD family antitoxin [Rubrivivax sp.]|nr:type II toxin-antitoxin system ParD family antitoxin [Rubrivivax sp.]
MSSTRTLNIVRPEALRVESGDCGTTSEHVDDLIRKDRREQRIRRLRSLVEDGLASGKATADKPADWDELDAIARGDIR